MRDEPVEFMEVHIRKELARDIAERKTTPSVIMHLTEAPNDALAEPYPFCRSAAHEKIGKGCVVY